MPRRRIAVAPDPTRPQRVTGAASDTHVAVIGGGIAGCAAATVLAERGIKVTLFEAGSRLGGRCGGWPVTLQDGTRTSMEHGFHAFFRQYYNLRALLARIGVLWKPIADYPVLSTEFGRESFARLPRRPPWSLVALVARTRSLGWRDLRAMDGKAATPLLAFDPELTYSELDEVSAAELLDSLAFPRAARALLFDVFSHSFFNREDEMSAAEMVMLFHFYFLGNHEGLLFDIPEGDYASAIWEPWEAYLRGRGVDIRLSTHVDSLTADGNGGWSVNDLKAAAAIVATDVTGAKALAAGTPLAPVVAPLKPAPPYAVLRVWTDRDCARERAPFAGISGAVVLDSISLYHRLEPDAAKWSERTGGGVYELHAYAAPPDLTPDAVRAALLADLERMYPETAGMAILEERWSYAADCTAFGVGSHRDRPGVVSGLPGMYLAGDWVRLPFPTALMERSAASGILAANEILASSGVAPEPVWSIRRRGLLARISSASWSRR